LPDRVSDRARLAVARRLERRARRSPDPRAAAIVFHSVGPTAGDHGLEIDPPTQVSRLEAAMGYLKRHYAPVRAAALPEAARGRRPGEPLPVAVTFDDDLASHATHALPVLAKHDVPGTAFLCGATSAFWWQLLQVAIDEHRIGPDALTPVTAELVERALERRRGAIGRLAKAIEDLDPADRDRVTATLERAVPGGKPLLGSRGTAALVAAGWEIGFHTHRHDMLLALDDDALHSALARRPQKSTGEPPLTLAYPHGKAGIREAQAARKAGYVAAYTGRSEVFSGDMDVHQIGRLQPDTATLGRFALQVARALSDS
jgi:peptidoglycan/xylan/chitin deacetylase (PgdA/CDA1 family)